jgi:predicted RNA-binding protein with PUA-like domain
MGRQYWLVKQEPAAYSWEQFLREGRTAWTGIRNFQARNYLRQMRAGDRVLFYHSVSEKRVVGVAEVVREAFPDPTAPGEDWSAVELKPVQSLKRPVTLEQIKHDSVLKTMPLVRQTRLSVLPVTREQFSRLLESGAGRITTRRS